MNVIEEIHRVHEIRYQRFYFKVNIESSTELYLIYFLLIILYCSCFLM